MSDLFNDFFHKLNDSGITYAVTGRTEHYPDIIHSDIDIIIPENQYFTFWKFMSSLNQDHIKWIQVISHEITAYYFVITIANGTRHQFLKPDVCSDYLRNGVLLLKAENLLSGREFNHKGFYQLAANKEFIYYLLKKVDKANINDEQFNHLINQWEKDKTGCIDISSEFFSESRLNLISKSLDVNDLDILKENLPLLKKDLHKKIRFDIKSFLLNALLKFKRVMQPTGLVIAFMGPDGAGKTTIINGVRSNLTEAFRKNKQFHLFPKEGKATSAIANPHEVKGRGYFMSLIKLLYFFGIYVIGYWWKIYPLKAKSTLVFFDRYYHDILVDPLRYRYNASKGWAWAIGKIIPTPDLWILLDAPAEVIQMRKKEVAPEETARQINSYRELFSKLSNSYIVDAYQSPESVTYEVEKIIINFMETRTALRYKNHL